MKADEINFSAFKYAETHVATIDNLCAPLFKLGIKVFAYFRFFDNGRYLYLCNRLDWLRFCLQNIHTNEDTSLGKEIGHALENDYHCFLWPLEKTDYLLSALYDFNIWNGLSIFKQSDGFVELWGMASDRSTENIQDFYVENVDLLKDFTASFSLNTMDIIIPSESNLAIYKDFKPLIFFDSYDCQQIENFINATPINKRPVITPSGEVFLSARELQCINLLSCGKTLKHIAQDCNISHRTVEKHIEIIKRKIGANSKSSIIQIYKNSVLNWL